MRSLPHASSLLLAVLALPAAAATPWPSRELRDRQAGWVQGLAFTPDGRFLASADASGTVIVRMFPGPKVYATLNGSHFSKVAWSVDGRTLVGAGLDNLVYVWRQPFMDDPRTLPYDGPVKAVSVSPDGVILAAGGGDHAIRRWRMPTMEELAPLKGHSDDVFTVRASFDGHRVASGGRDRTLRVWDAAAGQSRILYGPGETVEGLAFSANGALLAAAYSNGKVGLWNTDTWRLERFLQGPSGPVRGVAISRRGPWLAGAGSDGAVWIWALGDTTPPLRMPGHRGPVNAVAFSPNGPWLASAGSDTTVRLWAVP